MKIILNIFLTLCACLVAHQVQAEPLRGMFVWQLDTPPVLCSRDEIAHIVSLAKEENINVLFVQLYRGNRSWFASKFADDTPYRDAVKSVGEDPLALLIRQAHAQGIEVHAWLNLLSLGGNADAKILHKYGADILTRNPDPKQSLDDYKIDRQFFLEPGDPRVRRELLHIVTELLRAYPSLDGIQFDYIRYPDVHPHYGYTPVNLKRFHRAAGQNQVTETNPVWRQWKRDQVTGLLEALVKKTRAMRPRIHISTTGCLSYIRAYEEAFQDWPSWLNRGLVEFVTAMDYAPVPADFKKNIEGLKPHVQRFEDLNIAVGAYKLAAAPNVLQQEMDICRSYGTKGCVLFHYGSLRDDPPLRRAAISLRN